MAFGAVIALRRWTPHARRIQHELDRATVPLNRVAWGVVTFVIALVVAGTVQFLVFGMPEAGYALAFWWTFVSAASTLLWLADRFGWLRPPFSLAAARLNESVTRGPRPRASGAALHVRLIEATECLVPVESSPNGDGTFLILATPDFDPEVYEFLPGDVVRAEPRPEDRTLVATQLVRTSVADRDYWTVLFCVAAHEVLPDAIGADRLRAIKERVRYEIERDAEWHHPAVAAWARRVDDGDGKVPHVSPKTEAEHLRLGVRGGWIPIDEVVRWADRQIELAATPHLSMIELALSRDRPREHVVALLHAVPGEADAVAVMRACLADLLRVVEREPALAVDAARWIEAAAERGELPRDRFGDEPPALADAFALARDGVDGTHDDAVARLLAFLKKHAGPTCASAS